jgi:hypothetical protein
MPHPTDGGRWDRPCHRPESRDTLPCENDQAKPDRFSRLARSTLLSKILESGPPKRCPWDRGPFSRIGVLELDALLACLTIAFPKSRPRRPADSLEMPGIAFASIFARTFRKYRTSRPKSSSTSLNSLDSLSGRRTALKFQIATSTIGLHLLGARKGFSSRVMQWLVLCGIPYRDQGCVFRFLN